jgi:TolB-like protein/Tfp pilus assembly protein PilF
VQVSRFPDSHRADPLTRRAARPRFAYTARDTGGRRVNDTPAEREAESTWTRLRRRKVVQWGLAYAAGAWVLLQVLGFATDTYGWPTVIAQLAMLGLTLGLPIVVTLAWYHGDRGQQRVTGPELAVLTLLLFVSGGVLWLYAQRSVPTTTTDVAVKPASPAAAIDARPSIAVLPFENRSREADDAFFVDGIHDDILTQLSKVGALRVISRTSVEQFRDTKLPMKAIADQLGVTKILEGGVQRAGARVRINMQLIDAGTDAHVWAESYDRELTAANIFAIQSEVASAIAGALEAALTPAEKARANVVPTRNLKAWEAYQLGKQRMAQRTAETLAEAEQFFRQAIDLDPKFALAYVGLADTLRLQTEYSGRQLEATVADADALVSRALELDANLAEAWASKGGIAWSRADDEQAEKFIRRAVELNPSYATAHHWLSQLLEGKGNLKEGLEHAEMAAQLDPLSAITQVNLGGSMELAGRYDEAASGYRRAIEVEPMSPVALGALASLYAYARNRFVDAVLLQDRAVGLDSGSPQRAGQLALLSLDIGDEARAIRLTASLLRQWPADVYANSYSAAIAASVGDGATAETHASKALAVYPRAHPLIVALLRNADLRRGDLQGARARYAAGYPELLDTTDPRVSSGNLQLAIDVALVFQRMGDVDRANRLLDACELAIRPISRLGLSGYGVSDAQIHALRGDKVRALAALREAELAGWRGPAWRYYRDFDPNLASIRNEPEFKAVFADIERDMAKQRAALAARPKDAPLDLAATGT